jgi:hypothetical protein
LTQPAVTQAAARRAADLLAAYTRAGVLGCDPELLLAVAELVAYVNQRGAVMRPKVYIAGPISKGDLAHNVNQATAAFVTLAKAGLAPLCPHWSVYSKPAFRFDGNVFCKATANGNDEMTHADWIGADLPWVAAADAVLRLPGESTGADMETAHARERGIPVFDSVEALLAHFAAAADRKAA